MFAPASANLLAMALLWWICISFEVVYWESASKGILREFWNEQRERMIQAKIPYARRTMRPKVYYHYYGLKFFLPKFKFTYEVCYVLSPAHVSLGGHVYDP